MERRFRGAWWGLVLAAVILAAPLSAQDIPSALQDWKGWVLHDVPEQTCPLLASPVQRGRAHQCVWPGRLTLDARAAGAQFNLDVSLDAPAWVALPGDDRHWPQQVQVDGKPQPVLPHDGAPSLRLAAGSHRVAGELAWSTRPSTLAVPPSIALLSLSIDGVPVEHVERNGNVLTLGEAALAQRAADALSVRVYRLLGDGLPAMLETQIQLNVAGTAREQLLGPSLPAGFVATALEGDLPARLENDGRLRVQLRPGQWTISLDARATAPLASVALTQPAPPWPAQETWSYADAPALRGTRVEGQGVDASRAGVPEDWREFPAYAVDASHGLTISEVTRGDLGGQGDQLHLRRELWLDFDGRGLSAVDHLTGMLRHHQRLDVTAPWQLQRAEQAGQPLLVSEGDAGRRGVELRQQSLDLSAGLRVPGHAGKLPSSGWQVPLESIDATLHLPPGYRLVGASGADKSPDSWVAQWTLLDLFVVAVIALLAGRALGWPWAALAAAFLALAQHESGAPRWTLAVVLAMALLLRALPDGRLRFTARMLALAAFALAVLWTLPFAAGQLQYALHPQLEAGSSAMDARLRQKAQVAPEGSVDEASTNAAPQEPRYAPAPPPPPPAASPASSGQSRELASVMMMGSRLASPMDDANQQLDSHSVVQAGTGEPEWDAGNNYRLGWSGPVTTDQGTRLVIAPAWLVRLLRVLMVALLAVLLARMVPPVLMPLRPRWEDWRRRAAGAAVLVVALLGAHPAHAQSSAAQALPDQVMLDHLRQRLTEAPTCAPHCVSLADAQLRVAGDALDLALEAHAGADAALALPQGDAALSLRDVSVDNRPATLVRRDDGLVLLRLDRGVHRVSMHFLLAADDSANLRFPLRPEHATFSGQGWSASGIDDGRLLGDSVALSRVRAAADGAQTAVTQSFPPYVRVTRHLVFGVDWLVQTEVERLAPENGGFSVTLPLLPGEHPLGDNAPVHDGAISVTFSANEPTVSWQSRIDRAASLVLKAPALSDRAEVWRIDAAPMWHVEAAGVPASASSSGQLFQPLPGETLTLALTEPKAVAGSSIAFDRAQISTAVGERASETMLVLTARSTRGGEHAITLPAGTELLQAQRDGEMLSLAVRDGSLSLPLLPGSHRYTLRLRDPHGVATLTTTSAPDLHAPVANISQDLQLPQDRWVLWTWGPSMGPAVLYWSQLAVLLLAAWLLARFAPTPLRFHHWLLLGLGFSAFAWSAYALVVVWLVALGLRARGMRMGDRAFNLVQIGLAVLTALAVLALAGAVPRGLLGLPDMHVAGNASSAWNLRWFADQSAGTLPHAGVFSVSLWVYKIAMLAWALWLANALIGWLRWGFEAWSQGGYWRRRAPSVVPPELPPASNAEPASHD